MGLDDLQPRVQTAIDRMVAGGAEVGIQVGVVEHGRVVADAASGLADASRGTPATAGTLFGFSPHRPGGVPSRPGSTFGMVGSNGSAAYADIDSGVAVAVMRNRFGGGLAAAAEIDRLVAEAFPATVPARPTTDDRSNHG